MATDNVKKSNESFPIEQNEPNTHVEPELTLRSGLALAGAALSYFCTVGLLNAFGVFQEYYSSVVLRGLSDFQISWIGSFATFCIFFFAPAAGLIADKWGLKIPMILGAVLEVVAIFMVSLCKEYWQFFLAQGVALGAGMAFVAIPASGACPRYFRRNRALASGISVAGSSLGGVIWPLAVDQLLHKDGVSFEWTMRSLGFIQIPLLAFVVLTVRNPVKQPNTLEEGTSSVEDKEKDNLQRREHRKDILKPPFLLLVSGLFLAYLGFFTPYYFTTTYATHLGMSQTLSFYLVSILNAGSLVGRILPGFWADKYGKFNLLIASAFSAAIVAFCWTTATSVAGLIIWVLAYGFASGAIMSLQLACGTTLVHENAAGAAVGSAMGSVSLAGLFGTPIAGKLVEHGYIALACWAGAALLGGSVLLVCSRLYQNRSLKARV